ncbi:MAG TPA: multidrug efflux protein [Gammaproteobacteria bacterium]|nr:multidrug efflux protein [Gammaproteobacteria bacterium]
MKFTDIFIQRPVLASVISLLILVLGLRSLVSMEVRQFPLTSDTVISVTTVYPGASSELIQGFITTPLQTAIAEADGIDYIASSSRQGRSEIQIHMELNYDSSAAIAEIQAKVASQRGVLPEEAEDPVITSRTGDPTALMYIPFFSRTLPAPQVNDYMLRVAQPKLQAIPGVGRASVPGGASFAMRVWLDNERLSALNINADQITGVLRANNYLSSVGSIESDHVTIDLDADTDISTAREFEQLVIANRDGALIRLGDVARIELGSENLDYLMWYEGDPSVFIAIELAPGANPLTVAKEVHRVHQEIVADLPPEIESKIAWDGSIYIQNSIDEVVRGLGEAVLIVLSVILLSLGSARAALIPALAVPLSIIGAATLMLILGYSINMLTLLAMILAIGLVVDDAIVVVENVHRHIELGETPMQAAILGARELALPVVAMTTTLVAVYAPIGFLGGLVGTLFTEFAFSLAAAVLVSGVVALTLAPMLASRILHNKENPGRFERYAERLFDGLAQRYQNGLHWVLVQPSAAILFAVLVLMSLYPMFMLSQQELAPDEDQGLVLLMGIGPETATIDYTAAYTREVVEKSLKLRESGEYDHTFLYLGFLNEINRLFGGIKLNESYERDRSQAEIQAQLQADFSTVAGMEIATFPAPSLPGTGGGLPIQFVVTAATSYAELDGVTDALIGRSMATGKFAFLRKDVKFSRPKATLLVDRDRAADLGLSMAQVGRDLSTFLSTQYSNRFSLDGRSYKVIPQLADSDRITIENLQSYYLTTPQGTQVPLSALVKLQHQVEPSKRSQMQQINSITIEGLMIPPNTIGDALAELAEQSEAVFPRGYHYDYTGPSRRFMDQGGALVSTFFMSLLVIYLVLAAQFESWRDPFIILISVPLSMASALAFIMLGAASVNIYTQVGLITLIGLIAKNGILIVEFANELQKKEGLTKREAVEKASAIRLRPIIMTTLAMIMAMIPLLLASGPGAVSRFQIGLVISTGLGIGTLFTLFVVPAFYLWLAKDHQQDAAVASAPSQP